MLFIHLKIILYKNKRSLSGVSKKTMMVTDLEAYLENLERREMKRRCLINQETTLAEIENIKFAQHF